MYLQPASIQVRNGILCKCKHCCDKLPEATGMHFERDQFSLSTVLRFKLSVGFEGHKFTFKYIQVRSFDGFSSPEDIILS